MDSKTIVPVALFVILALICFVIAYYQFKGKGFLFNNAYIYASKKERLKLNKAPYYRQSAIVFTAIAINFLLIASNLVFKNTLLTYASIGLMIVLVVYALGSTIRLMTKEF